MWAMTALPLFGWAVTLWLIFTHERVTCFNYHAVLAWLDSHELHHEDDDGDSTHVVFRYRSSTPPISLSLSLCSTPTDTLVRPSPELSRR